MGGFKAHRSPALVCYWWGLPTITYYLIRFFDLRFPSPPVKCPQDSRYILQAPFWLWNILLLWHSYFVVQSLSPVCLLVTPWTESCHQAPQSMGILQARILEWVAISFSGGSSQTRDQTHVSCIGKGILYHWATREDPWWNYTSILKRTTFIWIDISIKARMTTSYAKTFDCVDHNKLKNSERDGNTRPPDLPLEKPICRSGSNS